jgi:methyl-accepting chemotaxis protein
LSENRIEADKAFAIYRATSVQADEKAAGDSFEKDRPAYLGSADRAAEALKKGELNQTNDILKAQVAPLYKATMSEINIIIASNARQANEVIADAAQINARVNWMLIIGITVAILVAAMLGWLVTRMITANL